MSDLISSDVAKSLLDCDDATLQNYINNGTIRAQRVNGELMLERVDVENLGATNPTSDSDDGTIILSGDSEDLSIDLGEVVDDSSQTMIDPGAVGSDSMTFGDELEVVNFNDGGTQELSFDDADATQEGLSFTDSNTVVSADVDETIVGTATEDDFQTVNYDSDADFEDDGAVQSTARRSVRSQRVREEEVETHWIWPTLLILTTLLVAFFIVPYLVMSMSANANLRSADAADGTASGHGAKDTMWTNIASAFAGFSVEPDQAAFNRTQPAGSEWVSISTADPNQPDNWRYKQYRGGDPDAPSRSEDFIIDNIESQPDPNDPSSMVPRSAQALDENGAVIATYPVEASSESAVDGNDDALDRQYKVILKYGN